MSLIADALRKIETHRTESSAREPERPPSLWPYRLLLAVGAVLVLAGLAAIGKGPAWRSTHPPQGLSSAARAGAVQQSTPGALFMAERQIFFSGTVRGTGKSMALLDNRAVEEGDTFRGMKLVRVLPREVELEKDGRVTTLKLKN